MGSNPVSLDFSKAVPIGETEEQKQAKALQQSVSFAAQQNPDEYAKRLALQKQTGISPDVSQGNEADVKHAADVHSLDYPALAVSHPRTTAWASNPDNAAVSGVDEIQRLTGMESRAASIRAMPSFGDRLKANYDNGDFSFIPGLKSVKALVKTVTETPGVRNLPINYGKTLGQGMDDARFLYEGVNKPLDTSLLQPVANGVDFLANNRPEVTKGVIPDAIWNVIAGVSKGEARSAAGLATPKNLAILLSSGNLPVNAKALLDTYFAAEMIPGVAETPKRIMDAPNAQEKIAAGFEGLVNAIFTKGVVSGIGSTHPFYEDMAHLVTSAEESKLRARSPEKFHEAMQQMFDGHDSLRIPAEEFDTYFQSKNIDPAQAAQQLGAKNYLEAKAAGTAIEIAPADFIGKLDPEHQKGLLGDIVNPTDGMTFNQRQKGEQELQKFVADGGMEKVLADAQKADAETQASPEYQDIKTQLRQKYIDAGETPEIADNYATLQANVYTNLARETGMKPAELMGLYAPKLKIGEAPEAPKTKVEEFTATMFRPEEKGGLYKVGDVIEGRDGRYEVLALEGKTAMGGQWYTFRKTSHSPTISGSEPTLYQPAYHGSPYKFDKFSLEHMGRGEGAQAYGYGLYFAGNKEVAEYYRNQLTMATYKGTPVDSLPRASVEQFAALSVARYLKQGDSADTAIKKAIAGEKDTVERYKRPDAILRELRRFKPEDFEQPKGQLYEANIPEDDTMLHWDKPLSEQPEPVKNALKNAGLYDEGGSDLGEFAGSRVVGAPVTGASLYDKLSIKLGKEREFGGGWSAKVRSDEAASKFLHTLGIDGIKYLDGSSRSKGEGNHNYVIFDDQAINILKTYYQGGDSPRGWFRVMPDGSFEIGKTKIGDLSTFVHEPAHSYLFLMSDLAKREGASENLKGDYQKILEFLGAKDGEALSTEQHEKWARANEQYLREGKAPSASLKGVFQRFAVWLSSIYKRASDLGVELSDDIRGVMDRLYAAEDGVNRAAKESGPRTFSSPEEIGWTPEQFQAYADSKGMEVEQAKAEIVSKMNEAAVRDRTEAWREEEKNTREAVTQEIDRRPEYTALRSLKKGKLDDGTPLTLNRDELIKQFGKERVDALQKKHIGIYRNEGGVDADVAAEMLGYGSGDELLHKLENVPRRTSAIDQATREFMTAKHGDIRYDGTLDDQARLALENDKKASNLHKELKDLHKKLDQVQAESSGQKAAARAIYTPPLSAFRTAAEKLIADKPLMDLQPNRYLEANRVASREAFDAMRKGDVAAAEAAKTKELLNHYLFREAVKAKELGDKWEAYGKKMSTVKELGKLGLAGQPFLDQIRGFLDRYSFRKESNADIRQRQETLAQFFTRMKEDENYEIPLDPMLLDESRQRNYREVPLQELRAVVDAMKAIEKAARRVNSVAAEGKRVALDAAAAQLEGKLFESLGEPETRNASDRARSWLEKFKDFVPDISVIMPEFIFERWDGLKKQGPWHDYLWDRYTDAVDHKNRLLEGLWPQIERSLSAKIDRSRKFYIKSMDVTLTKDDILSIAHNAGNESNLDKQMRGGLQFGTDQAPRPMTAENLMEILSHLTAEEIDLVNSNWRAVGSLKPDAAELARKRTGVEPPWIEPKPLQVKNGTLEGGYWPVHFDPRFSAAGEKQVDTTLSVDKMFADYASANTNQGYLVGRTGFVAPLSLDWQGTMSRHLNDVVTDISHWEFASDAQRLLKHPQTKSAIISRMGELYYKNLLSWVKYTVKQGSLGPEPADTLEGFRRNMRSKVSTAVLGFRVANAAVETGITPILALQHVSPASSLHGVTTYLSNPVAATRFAAEASDYIRHIDTGIDRNVSEAISQLKGDHSLLGDIRRWSIQARVQIWKIGAVMAWHAGYHDAMSRGLEGKAAVREADSIYRMTQEAGRPGDLSSVQRNKAMNELTMFMGPSLIQYNNLRRSVMAIKDQGLTSRTAALGATTLLAGLAANTILFDALRGKAPDDKKKIPAWMLARLTFGMLDGLPIINQFSTYAEHKVLGEPGGDMKLIPVLQVGKDTVDAALKTTKAFQGDGTWEAAIKQDARAAGALTGFPAMQTSITGQYIYDVLSGKYQPAHPWSPVTDAFYARPKH